MASLNFKGKTAVWNHHLSVPYCTLEKVKENSLAGENEAENLLIEWDNLIALKALLPKYRGKVKCVYIDPPYNTWNEGWAYNDNVSSPIIKEWLWKVIDKEDMTRHDKWLCMMTPRIKLLRELLKDDGVMFISIDENEVHHLKSLLNEIFHESNFVAMLPVIMNLKWNPDTFWFTDTHEYCLVYSKDIKSLELWEFDVDEDDINSDWEEDEYWLFKRADTLRRTWQDAVRSKRPKWWFPVFITSNWEVYVTDSDTPNNSEDTILFPVNEDWEELSWTWSKKKIIDEPHNLIVINWRNGLNIYKKQRPQLWDLPTKKPKSVMYKPDYSTSTATTQLKKLFWKKIFEWPKPVPFIHDLLKIGTDKNSIILDSFAWSGTTAQAVMELNQEDGGNRKFILVQLPETLSEKAQAKLAGYGYVHEITHDRIKKVKERDSLKVGMTYYRLGEPIEWTTLVSWENLPTWESFAKYIHFLATGKPLDSIESSDDTWEIKSSGKSTGVFLIYKDTIEELKNLAITRDWLELVKAKEGKKIVYAPACFLDKEVLDDNNISFVQIPYNLFERK